MVLREVKKAVNDFFADLDMLARNIFADNGQLPILFAFLKQEDGKFNPALADLSELHAHDKDMYIIAVKQLIKEEKPIAIGTISEAWMVKRELGEADAITSVQECDDKIEAIIISIETYDSNILKVYEIIRDGDNVTLDLYKNEVIDCKENVRGNFTNLLQENYEEFYNELKNKIKNNVN
jgi:hypothetical protein